MSSLLSRIVAAGRCAAAMVLLVGLGGCGGAAPSLSASSVPTTRPSASPTPTIASGAPSVSASEPGDSAGESPTAPPRTAPLVTVTDDTGAISIAVPASWSVLPGRWYLGAEDRGPSLVASSDVAAFAAAFDGQGLSRPAWGLDGIFVGLSRSLADELQMGDSYATAITALARWHGGDEETERDWAASCLRGGVSLYDSDNGQHSGFVTGWQDCDGIGTLVLDLGATGSSGGYVAQVIAVMPDGDVDLGLASDILISLDVDADAVEP